jgi:tetratricopeptide (TPR) repeat protein
LVCAKFGILRRPPWEVGKSINPTSPAPRSFGDTLRLHRVKAGLTQEELATRSGLSVRAIGALECGKSAKPYKRTVRLLSKALKLTDAEQGSLTDLASRPPSAAPATPRQLPGATAHFAGRANELAALDKLLDDVGGTRPGTAVISAVGGTAGVGKTALAVHWAHQAAHRFAHGQLYVNLRGYDPSGVPVTPAEAISWFLGALGVLPDQIPQDLAAQASLYRSLLAGRQMLIVLDNARDEQQVRPLLPGSPGCLVIVTSRRQLVGLAATDGASLLTLDLLSHDEARQMLAQRLGSKRAAAEPDAVDQIVSLSARLPLALAIAAARAAARPSLPLDTLAAELRDASARLDALDTPDPAASVRAVFSWSAQHLGSEAARMFGLLGLHPGPDITIPAAASLAGITRPAAGRELRELTAANLISEHLPGRYTCHDLLRSYAVERAPAADGEDGRAAGGRVLDHYLHTAHAAALLLNPHRMSVPLLSERRPGAVPERLDDARQALAWFEAERQVLQGCVVLAAQTGSDACAWKMPWAMSEFLDRRGHWNEWAATQRTALAAATRLHDMVGQAAAHRAIATACVRLTDYQQARGHLAACLRLYRQLDDPGGEALARHSLGRVAEHEGRYADALRHEQQALGLFQEVDHEAGQAVALNAIGWYHILLGRPEQARTFCQQALSLYCRTGDRVGQAQSWDSLGYAEHQLGRLDHATTCYQQALGIFCDLGELYGQADTLGRLGDTRAAAADLPAARDAWQQALNILDELRHPAAEHVRAKLGPDMSTLTHQPTPT